MKGRTPYEVFKAGIPGKRTRIPSARKEVKNAPQKPDLGEARCQVISLLAHPG